MGSAVRYAGILALLTALAGLSPPASYGQSNWARELFKVTEHDFGTVSRGAKTQFVFPMENCFEEPVHIAAVRSSCGCTAARPLSDTLGTWEKGGIVAELNTTAFIGGKTAAITVTIDRPYYAEVQLLVMGHIRSDIVTEPGQIDFGSVPAGREAQRPLVISYAGRPDWQIADVRGTSDYVGVKIVDVQRTANLTRYELLVRLLPTAPPGLVRDNLVFVTGGAATDRFSLPLAANVLPPLRVAPERVELGDIPAGQVSRGRLVLTADEPFEVTGLTSTDPQLRFTQPSTSAKVHILTFEHAATGSGKIDGQIQISTSISPAAAISVPFSGRITPSSSDR